MKDSGIGIKKEDQGLIFQENVMLNNEEKYQFKGSGLGLSICKTMARTLGHDIGFNSNFEQGSEFYLKIKYEKQLEEKEKNIIIENKSLLICLRIVTIWTFQTTNNHFMAKMK